MIVCDKCGAGTAWSFRVTFQPVATKEKLYLDIAVDLCTNCRQDEIDRLLNHDFHQNPNSAAGV